MGGRVTAAEVRAFNNFIYGMPITSILIDDIDNVISLTRQSETAQMSNRPRNTTDEMLAVVNAQKQGLTIEVARRADPVERFALMTNPAFNFMDFRYRVKREARRLYAIFGCNAVEPSAVFGNREVADRKAKSLNLAGYRRPYTVVEFGEVQA